MTTKDGRKSKTLKFLESLNSGPLSLGALLEAIRLGEKVSQSDFARRLKISRSHLCDIEKRRKLLSPMRAAKFARVLRYGESQFVRLALQDQVAKAKLPFEVLLRAA
jgi:DNA-binding transcriptional regulator YiaG